ncbi:MAG: hypothetical protein ACTSUC_01845 [Promethearchaeota archaeon]
MRRRYFWFLDDTAYGDVFFQPFMKFFFANHCFVFMNIIPNICQIGKNVSCVRKPYRELLLSNGQRGER